MSHDCDIPKSYKIVKQKQPGTAFWPKIATTIWHEGHLNGPYHNGFFNACRTILSLMPIMHLTLGKSMKMRIVIK